MDENGSEDGENVKGTRRNGDKPDPTLLQRFCFWGGNVGEEQAGGAVLSQRRTQPCKISTSRVAKNFSWSGCRGIERWNELWETKQEARK